MRAYEREREGERLCVHVCVCVSGHTSVCVESEDILMYLSAFLSISFPVCLLAYTCFFVSWCFCCSASCQQQDQTSVTIVRRRYLIVEK